MTAEEYYRLLPDGVAPRLVRMAHDFAALADTDPEAAGRKLDAADVIFAVWRAENGAFGFIPVFGGDRLVNCGKKSQVGRPLCAERDRCAYARLSPGAGDPVEPHDFACWDVPLPACSCSARIKGRVTGRPRHRNAPTVDVSAGRLPFVSPCWSPMMNRNCRTIPPTRWLR